jgi:Flp pilus assembly pilin Flp
MSMGLPPFIPNRPQLTRVDVDPDRQRRFLQQNGLRLLWERAALCPCGSKGLEVLPSSELRSQLVAAAIPGDADAHDALCPVCFGEGVIYYASQEIRALALGMQINYQPQGLTGDYAPGYAAVTTFPEHQPNYRDRPQGDRRGPRPRAGRFRRPHHPHRTSGPVSRQQEKTMKTIRNFLSDEQGFEGAEKALLICVGLAIVLVVGGLIREGANKAGTDAKNALNKNPLGG